MKIGRGTAVRRDLGRLFGGHTVAGLGESELLGRFVDRRDESAFAALVARHGPMVLGVCRRLLADPLDAEDAFQATFLVLVRRAGSLRDRDRLAPWLFGVARKVATRARDDRARRRAREAPGAEDLAADPGPEDHRRELGRALIEEIDRLPAPLREPIVLCCVEGLSYDEAAARLRSTASAIRGRLARARARLRDRLTRRGLAPSAGALGALLTAEAAESAVPNVLSTTTIRASIAGTVPAGVEALAEGVIRTMILTKSKFLAAAVMACGLAGSSITLNAQDGPATPQPPRPPEADRLDKVEQKLDRVLRALEGPDRGDSGPIVRAKEAADQATLLFEKASQAGPSQPPPPVAQPATAAPAPPSPPAPPAPPALRTRAYLRVIETPEDRLTAIEQKLKRLEDRLDQLERRLPADRTGRENFGPAGAAGPQSTVRFTRDPATTTTVPGGTLAPSSRE